jgi:nucleoside-diphosphate-sugar epimerase
VIAGEKVLVTGASGDVALPLIKFLSSRNEVWGAARFADPAARQKVEAAGGRPVAIDVAGGECSILPTDFTYVLHLAYYRGGSSDFDQALKVNGEGTGRVLQHCRDAKAALVMSATSIYSPWDDPWHFPKEDEAIGGANVPWSPTSGTSKIAQEAVARFCAEAFELPIVIGRLNTVYGEQSPFYLPNIHMDSIIAGREVTVRWDPMPHTPIHTEDMCEQLEAMLGAASVPATIVNWGGDEVVTTQDWCKLAGELAGVNVNLRTQPVPNTTRSTASDQTRRRIITGPSKVAFADAYRRRFESLHGA